MGNSRPQCTISKLMPNEIGIMSSGIYHQITKLNTYEVSLVFIGPSKTTTVNPYAY